MYGNGESRDQATRTYDAPLATNRESRFQRVDKQLEVLRSLAAEISGRSAQVADRLCGGEPHPGEANVREKNPPMGLVDDWSARLDQIHSYLTEAGRNIGRVEGEL